MLTEIYIEALLVDEDLADQVWEDWRRDDFRDIVTGNCKTSIGIVACVFVKHLLRQP